MYWPGEKRPGTQLVHFECEIKESQKALNDFSNKSGNDWVYDFLKCIE